MTNLPKVQENSQLIQAVNARELHGFLEVGRDFSNWIKDRIVKYEFTENVDYVRVAKNGVGINQGFQPIDYYISLDMAKELAMVENNEQGKTARKYFIECERKAKQPLNLENPIVLRDLLLSYTEKNIALIAENEILTKAIDNVTNTADGVKFQQACKILNVKQPVLAKWLRDNNWDRYINKSRASTHYSQERGYCMTKYEEVDGVKPSGEPFNYTKIEFFILPKGMSRLTKEFAKAVN
ncbi:antA/AntB antirepressor family protein [Faucicola mancuniensis]|uniref:antA/AntB antirepressor family protein n=1 Tax=Faucicola mancuniensis TaxID=1309795 RepID=UPI003977C1ED